MGAALHGAAQKPAALEHLDVLGGARERHAEGRGKFADGALAIGQRVQHLAAGGIGERVEDCIQAAGGAWGLAPGLCTAR
jgi:hypothetical protein